MSKKEKLFSFTSITGFILILLGFLIWTLRPLAKCAWYNIFCNTGSLLISPIYLILSAALAVGGTYLVLKGIFDRRK